MTRTAREAVGAVLHLRRPRPLSVRRRRTFAAQPAAPPPPVRPVPRSTTCWLVRRRPTRRATLLRACSCFSRPSIARRRTRCVLERAEALRRLALADDFALKYDEARQKLDEAAAVFRRFGVALGEAQALTQIGFTRSSRAAVRGKRNRRSAARSIWRGRSAIRSCSAASTRTWPMPSTPGPEKDRLREEALAFVRSTPSARATECNLLHQWGDEQFVLGRYDAGVPHDHRRGRLLRRGRRPEPPRTRYVSLGRVYRAHGRLDLALEQYERALALQQAAGDRLAAVQSLNAIAVTYGYMGRYDEGARAAERGARPRAQARIGSERRLLAREHRRDLQRPRPLPGGGRDARGDAGVAERPRTGSSG